MDFISLPPPRPPPRLGLPRAILSNLAVACKFVFKLKENFATVKIPVKIWWIWFVLKIFKTILSRDVCATGKDSEVSPKGITQPFSRNFVFPCRYEFNDWLDIWLTFGWMFRQTLDDLSAMSSRNRSAEGERANAAATSGAPSLEGSFKTQNILPFLTILRDYLRQRFILQ